MPVPPITTALHSRYHLDCATACDYPEAVTSGATVGRERIAGARFSAKLRRETRRPRVSIAFVNSHRD